MAVAGSLTPLFCCAIAGSSHFVILPLKIWAIVAASSFSNSTPFRLNTTAIGSM